MFNSLISKVLLGVSVVLLGGCIFLGISFFAQKQKVDDLNKELENRNTEIADLNSEVKKLNAKINGLNFLVKHNDEVASKTINSLNDTIKLCQQKQDEIVAICDRRVQLALESREVDIAVEEITGEQQEGTANDSGLIKGIDQDSSSGYIEELNKMIYGFTK